MKQTENQELIAAVQKLVRDGARKKAIAKVHHKNESERVGAEVNLLLDDIHAEGIAPDSPLEMLILIAKAVKEMTKGDGPPKDPDDPWGMGKDW